MRPQYFWATNVWNRYVCLLNWSASQQPNIPLQCSKLLSTQFSAQFCDHVSTFPTLEFRCWSIVLSHLGRQPMPVNFPYWHNVLDQVLKRFKTFSPHFHFNQSVQPFHELCCCTSLCCNAAKKVTWHTAPQAVWAIQLSWTPFWQHKPEMYTNYITSENSVWGRSRHNIYSDKNYK